MRQSGYHMPSDWLWPACPTFEVANLIKSGERALIACKTYSESERQAKHVRALLDETEQKRLLVSSTGQMTAGRALGIALVELGNPRLRAAEWVERHLRARMAQGGVVVLDREVEQGELEPSDLDFARSKLFGGTGASLAGFAALRHQYGLAACESSEAGPQPEALSRGGTARQPESLPLQAGSPGPSYPGSGEAPGSASRYPAQTPIGPSGASPSLAAQQGPAGHRSLPPSAIQANPSSWFGSSFAFVFGVAAGAFAGRALLARRGNPGYVRGKNQERNAVTGEGAL